VSATVLTVQRAEPVPPTYASISDHPFHPEPAAVMNKIDRYSCSWCQPSVQLWHHKTPYVKVRGTVEVL